MTERGRWYPRMPPMLPDETDDQYTDRLTGADGTGRRPYDHRRNRQCSIGWHEECSDPNGERCQCPCHAEPRGATDMDRAAADYQAQMDQLGALAHRMAALKLDWLAHTIDGQRHLADSVGPVTFPTMYRHADLTGQRRLVAAAQTVREVLADITKEAPA